MSEKQKKPQAGKLFSVEKLYVGGHSRDYLERAAVALIQDGGISRLSENEKKLYQRSMLERGSNAPTAVMELALAALLERLTGSWPREEAALEQALAPRPEEAAPADEESVGHRPTDRPEAG